jgi:3-carboxy-cis,cis-muconate cycloisomerase
MLRFESALASAQAKVGAIPEAAATAIRAACDHARFDVAAIGRESAASATPVVPLVDALRRTVGAAAAEFVHRGATSQDVIDTAMMLVARDGLDLLVVDLSALASRCAELAKRYRATPMAGRTLLLRARPITFGFKAAGWLVGVVEARRRLVTIRHERLALQLGGPVGTGESYGDTFVGLRAQIARELGLAEPPFSWQTDRGRVAELGSALAVAAGAAAKIALDVILLSQTEVGEVAEASAGRSSAMPEKRNPARSVLARTAFSGAVAQAGMLLGAMAGEHERSAGAWQSEWPALSEAFRSAAGAVARAREAITDLVVDERRMLANLGPGRLDGVESAGAQVDIALELYAKD